YYQRRDDLQRYVDLRRRPRRPCPILIV
ncbi:hypothetical protein PanWU01x14_349900, partial [Parasponia andersonii]